MPTIARLTLKHAAEALDVSPRTLRTYLSRGLFDGIYPFSKGMGKPAFILKSQIEDAILDWSTAERRAEAKLWKSQRRRHA